MMKTTRTWFVQTVDSDGVNRWQGTVIAQTFNAAVQKARRVIREFYGESSASTRGGDRRVTVDIAQVTLQDREAR